MLRLARATAGDLLALLAAKKVPLSQRAYTRLVVQFALSETYAVHPTAATPVPVALGGIAPLPRGAGEVWFGAPTGGLGPHAIGVIRLARAVLSVRASRYPGGLLCHVEEANANGARLARALGFVPAAAAIGLHRTWRFHGLRRQGVQSRPVRRDAVPAGAAPGAA